MLSLGCSSSEDIEEPMVINLSTGIAGVINHGETLAVSVTGLQPGEYPVEVTIGYPMSGDEAPMDVRAKLTADADGRIDNAIIAYDVGLRDLQPGYYSLYVEASKGMVVGHFTVPDEPIGPVVWDCDIDGEFSNAFESGEPVFFAANALEPGETYRAWPVKDRREWLDGDIFKSWKMEQPASIWPEGVPEYVEAVADENGEIAPTQLIPYASKFYPGLTDQFDIVLDAAPFGAFNSSTDAVDGKLPTGVVVQDEPQQGHIITQLAARENYTYTDVFEEGESVYIWLNPGVRLIPTITYVYKYIVEHQDEWIDGTPLTDITAGAEADIVQYGCINEGIILVWVYALEGEYDALIDINANGIYDEGTDILDWSAGAPGFRVIQ